MHRPLVTVVIPVYKTEKWLDRCAASVAGQRYSNLEILLIDDGSPDDCPRLCDAWTQRDSRIRVIHKENAGLGMARNTGMDQARGRYLCFVDSDDTLEETAIEAAVEMVEGERADIVLYGMTCLDPSGRVTAQRIPETEKQLYSGREVQERLLPRLISGEWGLTMSACCCLVSAEVIRNGRWRFPSEREIISEDVYALLGLFYYIRKAAVLKSAPYCYYETPRSLTRTYREDRSEKILVFYRACLALCDACGYGQELRRRCAAPVVSFLIAAMKQEAACRGIRALPRLREILAQPLLQQALRETDRGEESWKKRLFLRCLRRHRLFPAYVLLCAQNRIE